MKGYKRRFEEANSEVDIYDDKGITIMKIALKGGKIDIKVGHYADQEPKKFIDILKVALKKGNIKEM